MTVVITPSSVATGTGYTLAQYVERLGRQLGRYAEFSVGTEATSGEERRLVLVDELRDDEEARSRMRGRYVYVKQGYTNYGEQSRVLTDGYEGPLGALVLARPYGSALTEGTRIALTHPFPVREYLDTKGLRDLVNEALQRIWIESRLTITGDGGYDHDLASAPWIWNYVQLRGIYDTMYSADGTVTELSTNGYRLVKNGITKTLITDYAYASAETAEVDVLVRADRLRYDGSDWGFTTEDTAGLSDDDDQAAAPIEWVVALGMVKGLQEWSKMVEVDDRLPPEEKQRQLEGINARRRQWRIAAAKIVMTEFPTPLPERMVPMTLPLETPEWT